MTDYNPYKVRGTDDSRAEGRLKKDAAMKDKKRKKLKEVLNKLK